ncbi:hypothetical protein ACJJTC_018416 [Scirpophaga incertulas]
MTELEARASEPGRYHNRGVKVYEKQTGQVFTVEGKPLAQLIKEDWQNRKAEHHRKLSARKEALTPNTTRPLTMSPLGSRNRTVAGLPTTYDTNRPPFKRQLITGSATIAMSSVSSSALSAARRTADTAVKRRISGRLAARAVAEVNGELLKRKLDYNREQYKIPKIFVNGSILRHKRTSHGKRRSITRRSKNTTLSSENALSGNAYNPLMDSQLLTPYYIFKHNVNKKQNNRSSFEYTKPPERNVQHIDCAAIEEKNASDTPKTTSKSPIVLTPNIEKENIHKHIPLTSKNNIISSPSTLAPNPARTLPGVKKLPAII